MAVAVVYPHINLRSPVSSAAHNTNGQTTLIACMAGNKMEPFDPLPMDCDETVDVDFPTADQDPIDSSIGYCQLRSGRRIVKAKHEKSRCGVRKKKRKRDHSKQTTVDTPQGKRQRQIQLAITNATYLFNGSEVKDNKSCVGQNQPEHNQRLTGEVVLQALADQTPGLTFPSHLASPFSSEEIKDLAKALEDYRVTIARKGTAIRSPDVAKLLKTFTHDVLCLLSRIKKRRRRSPRGNLLWDAMSQSFKIKGSRPWLREAVLKKLDEIYGVGKAKHLRTLQAFSHAIVAQGKCPELDSVWLPTIPFNMLGSYDSLL